MLNLRGLSGRTALVTGASGFIGSHVCRTLHDRGMRVYAISRSSPPDMPSIHWQPGDLTDLRNIKRLLELSKPDLIVHATGYVTAVRDLAAVLPIFHSDLVATVNLLTVATEVGFGRMVLTGSLEEPMPTGSDIVPSSPYAAAKWASGTYARMFHRLFEAPIVILRLSMTYGPGDQRLHKLIPYVTRSLLLGKSPKLTSGQRRIDWIYIDDVATGILAAAQAPDVEGSTIDLGSGILISIQTVVQHLVQLIDARVEPSFGALPDRTLEQVRMADTAIALNKLNWKPTVSLVEGLTRTVEWHRRQLGLPLA